MPRLPVARPQRAAAAILALVAAAFPLSLQEVEPLEIKDGLRLADTESRLLDADSPSQGPYHSRMPGFCSI